jgi:hypothetical protein
MASVVVNGDTSGAVTLSAPAVAGTVTVTLPSTSGTMAVLPTATGVLTEANGGTGTTTGYYGFKNRIINGAMVIDQRNAGAVVTPVAGATTYVTDRFAFSASQNSKFTAQQNAGNLTGSNLPTGFTKYLGATSSSAYTVGASEFFTVNQRIEGFNIADLGWGTVNAATVTLSFQVRSSLTGTFGGSLYSYSGDVSYPFSYTISSANTWTTISITIAGPTTGTFPTDNSGSLVVNFSLGSGATVSGVAGSWSGTLYRSATGATSVVGTNGATFYITGVQLEKGSTATSFDYRPYTTELTLCYRYYRKYYGSNAGYTAFGSGVSAATTQITRWGFMLDVPMRATPTPSFSSAVGYNGQVGGNITVGTNFSSTNYVDADLVTSGLAATVGLAGKVLVSGTTGFIELTGAEL